tara:strand:+ start:89 stop:232 length:144 start_codon:yes stop_codon:yes gene_type:complete
MKIINLDEILEFAEENDLKPLAGDMFEDAGGHIMHEDEVIELMEGRK